MNPNIAIAILLITFVLLIMIKCPITFSMIISTAFTMLYIQVPVMTLVQQMSKQLNSFSLLAIPFFILMGYLGLAFFILLLFGLVLWSLRSIGRTGYTKGDRTRVLAVSMFAGMCGVLVHCYFENIFEVPYMMAYFWSMAAAAMYLGYFRKRKT